ncbi:hypothetical protein SCB29_22110 [Paraburkholderia sp. SIMBA_055]
MPARGASGGMMLRTEYDLAGSPIHVLRLESATNGKAVLLLEVDERKLGIHREVRYEITPSELIAAIRANGAALPGKPHNDGPISDPM